jgi:hypothetical protein
MKTCRTVTFRLLRLLPMELRLQTSWLWLPLLVRLDLRLRMIFTTQLTSHRPCACMA